MTRLTDKLLLTAQVVGVSLILFMPAAGSALVFITATALRQLRLSRGGLALWLGFGLPLVATRLALGDKPGAFYIAGLTLFALFLQMIYLPRQIIRSGILLALTAALPYGLLTQQWEAKRWRPINAETEPIQFRSIMRHPVVHLTSELANHGFVARRSWRTAGLTGTQTLLLRLRARRVGGVGGWDWRNSGEGATLQALAEGETLWQPDTQHAWISRHYETNEALAGRTFRAKMKLRAIGKQGSCGQLHLAVAGTAARSQRRFCVDSEAQTLEHIWTVPTDIRQNRLNVTLANLAPQVGLEISKLVLTELRSGEEILLGPPYPLGLFLKAESSKGASSIYTLDLAADWQIFELDIDGSSLLPAENLWVDLGLEKGVEANVQLIGLWPSPTELGRSLPSSFQWSRQAFLTDHPNLAGHSFAVLGTVFLTLGASPFLALIGFYLSLLLIFYTGSRTALFTFLIVGTLTIFIKHSSSKHVWSVVMVSAIFMLLVVGTGYSRFNNLTALGAPPRTLIWQAVLFGTKERPLEGISEQTLNKHIAHLATKPQVTLIRHAHNIWLEFLRRYGIVGLLVSLWLTAGLLIMSWKKAEFCGLLPTGCLLLLNSFDYTLFYASVFVPYILLFNSRDT